MRMAILAKFIPWVLAAGGTVALAVWLLTPPDAMKLSQRLPGADRLGASGATTAQATELGGTLVRSEGVASDLPGAWPTFRGMNRDGISTENVRLARKWPAEGPAKLWSLSLGEGYAGAAVLNGRAYVLDYDQQDRADVLRCLSLGDGKEIWRRSYAVDVKRNHGMSRTVPAVTDRYVVTLGPKCHVMCVDAISGQFRWGMDLVAQFHAKVPPWYAGQCPLIEADRAILAPGGDALMLAVDCATGKILWQTPNPKGWEMTHSSIVPMTLEGKRMYVYCGNRGVAGVSAEDGSILWQSDAWKVSMATVPTPVVIGDGRIFLSGGYGAGSLMLRVKQTGEKFDAEVLYRLKPEVFGSEQQTPIYYNGYLYGVIPGGQLVCLNLDGKVVWSSGADHFGIGPYMVAGGMIWLMNDTGVLSAVEATAEGYRPLARSTIFESGHEAWGPFALAGGRLIARDLRRMVCLDVKESAHE